MTIAEKILSVRKNSGMTQEEFGALLGVSRQAVSKWEKSETLPDTEYIVKIAKEFNVSTDYLLLDSDENKHSNFSFENVAKKNIRFRLGVFITVLGVFYHLFLKKNCGHGNPVYILGLEFSGYLAWAFRQPSYGIALMISLILIMAGIIICVFQAYKD